MLKKVLTLAAMVLASSSVYAKTGSSASTEFYPSQYSELWMVSGQIFGDEPPLCGIVTQVPGRDKGDDPLTFAIGIPVGDKGHPFFVITGTGSEKYNISKEENINLLFDLPNGQKELAKITIEPMESGNPIAYINVDLFIPMFTKAERLTILYPEGKFITLNLSGTSKAVYVYLRECMAEYQKLTK